MQYITPAAAAAQRQLKFAEWKIMVSPLRRPNNAFCQLLLLLFFSWGANVAHSTVAE